MKKRLMTLFTFILLVGTSCQEKIDIEKEKEAIKAVIEEELDAVFDNDIDRMNATWYQDSSSRKVDICEYCGTNEYVGWINISKKNREAMEPARIEVRKELSAIYSNYDINVYDNTALVYHGAVWSGKLNGEKFYYEDKRILHLRKIKGEWKIDLFAHYSLPEEEYGIKKTE